MNESVNSQKLNKSSTPLKRMKINLNHINQPFTFSDFIHQNEQIKKLTKRAHTEQSINRKKQKIKLNQRFKESLNNKQQKEQLCRFNFLNNTQLFNKKQFYLGRNIMKNIRFYSQAVTPEKKIIQRLERSFDMKISTFEGRNNLSKQTNRIEKQQKISHNKLTQQHNHSVLNSKNYIKTNKKTNILSRSLGLLAKGFTNNNNKNIQNPQNINQEQNNYLCSNKSSINKNNNAAVDYRQMIKISKLNKVRRNLFNGG